MKAIDITTKALLASLFSVTLIASAIADEPEPEEVSGFALPVTEVQPERLNESEIMKRARAAQAELSGAGTQIRRREFDASVFNNNANLPEDYSDRNLDRVSRELMLARDPGIEPYLDEFGRPIQRAQQRATPSNEFVERVRREFKPEQSYTLRPRQNQAIPVGVGLMNSIETNFKSVAVRTSDDASIIEIEDGYIYITPNGMAPIGIIAYEDGVLESQVSLLLVPANAPPAMVDVNVQMTTQMQIKAQEYQARLEKERIEARAESERRRSELSGSRQSGHTRSIVDTLTPVARGQIPQGFSLSSSIPERFKYPCRVAIRHETGQRLSGGTEYIDVVIMHNDLDHPYEVREEMCLSEDAKAVAIFKASYLMPGEETEIYILRDKEFYNNRSNHNTRPRLTFGDR
ncbi:type-F conjugative transfer system secretin TraK [Aliidiomarina quisquiliarum]|uniref:type-F conjugative transfer system secretin TraK n=1 Tax=Aliidiomarina quisquiliarum TaxID=2938947 RepID=UPI00208E9139|nr:type-F conjugative transfer system secretin TraK [Aliidiomarina quisquiliarum]MCO4319905.1 type-F conjugative transfer system secretin TraK [Aliidiomarina quisquiliarum]